MKKNIKLSAILLAISTMGLTACGGSSGNDSSPSNPDTDGTYAKINVPDGITPKVVFWHTFGDKIESEVDSQLKKFQEAVKEKEGVNIEVDLFHYGNYNDTTTTIGSNLNIGTGPTMAVSYADSVAALMKRYDNAVINMEDYMNNATYGLGTDGYLGDTTKQKGGRDFIQSYLDEGRQFSTPGTYVLPYMKSSEIMLYNLEALRTIMPEYKPEINIGQIEDYLKNISFNELMNIADYAYKNKNKLGLSSLDYPVYYDSDANMIISQLDQKGLKFATRDDKGNVVLNLDSSKDKENYDKAAELVNQYRTWHNEHLLTTKGDQNTYASEAFKDRKAIFCIGSSGGVGYSFPSVGSFDFGVCKVPYAGESSESAKYISQGPSIAFFNNKSLSDEQNYYNAIYSWKFYKYITNVTNNSVTCFNHSEGYVPVKKSCYQSSDWQDYVADKENMYAKCALVLREEIGDNFITSLVFNGSGTYREQAGALVTNALKTNTSVSDLIATMINNTITAMGE